MSSENRAVMDQFIKGVNCASFLNIYDMLPPTFLKDLGGADTNTLNRPYPDVINLEEIYPRSYIKRHKRLREMGYGEYCSISGQRQFFQDILSPFKDSKENLWTVLKAHYQQKNKTEKEEAEGRREREAQQGTGGKNVLDPAGDPRSSSNATELKPRIDPRVDSLFKKIRAGLVPQAENREQDIKAVIACEIKRGSLLPPCTLR
eukprot:TRINITY_DN83427_c0_g1_i5.p1 TRINITY_DN83427_c0_g1~~TRINITY_DN83427_c0_g1_i5.p1  ORF type:complete len:204 (-),score=15.44 TRINITY_DN83427_c0_g1_i5:4-615(-)